MAIAHARVLSDGASTQSTSTDGIDSRRKRKPVAMAVPYLFLVDDHQDCIWNNRRRLAQEMLGASPMPCAQPNWSDHEPAQPPPPSQLAASKTQRPYRIQLSRAKRKLHGGFREKGMLYFLQMFTAYLQFIGRQYSATGQDPVIFFETKDLVSTRRRLESSFGSPRQKPTHNKIRTRAYEPQREPAD